MDGAVGNESAVKRQRSREFGLLNVRGVVLPILQIFACALVLPCFGNTGVSAGHTLANICIALLVPVINSMLIHYEREESGSPELLWFAGSIACGIATVYVPIFLWLPGCFSVSGLVWFLTGVLACAPVWLALWPALVLDGRTAMPVASQRISLIVTLFLVFGCVIFGLSGVLFVPLAYVFIFVVFTTGVLFSVCPALSLAVTTRLLSGIACGSNVRHRRALFGLGLASGIMLVLLPDFSLMVTRFALKKAESYDVGTASAAVRMLRRFGNPEQIGDACRDPLRAALDVPALLFRNAGKSAMAIPTYYRVTGNYCRPEEHSVRLDRALEERAGVREAIARQDSLIAGEDIGPAINGLSLSESLLRAEVSESGALAKSVWTLAFSNNTTINQEARMEFLMPSHAVVSGVWIWMNGTKCRADIEPREAARSKYTEVVRVRRRDPVLVTTTGPNKVLAQCFPVPAASTLRIELEFAYPVSFEKDRSYLPLPIIAAGNFAISRPHVVETPHGEIEQVCDEQLRKNSRRNRGLNHPPATVVSSAAKVEFVRVRRRPLSSLFVVIDGGKEMAAASMEILRGIERANPTIPLSVSIASDEETAIHWPRIDQGDNWKGQLQRLKNYTFVGGPDNLPALVHASMSASARPNSGVFWIHGPQPYLYGSAPPGQIANFFAELKDSGVVLSEYEAVPGPNKIVQSMEDPLRVSRPIQIDSVMRTGSVSEDVERHLNYLFGRSDLPTPRFALLTSGVRAAKASAGEDGLLRSLCARDRVGRLIAAGDTEKATQVACNHEIVSPVTGAVKIDDSAAVASMSFAVPNIQPYEPGLDGAVRCLARNALALWFERITSQLDRLNASESSSFSQLNRLNVAPGSSASIGFSTSATAVAPPQSTRLPEQSSGLQSLLIDSRDRLKLSGFRAELVPLLVLIAKLIGLACFCISAFRIVSSSCLSRPQKIQRGVGLAFLLIVCSLICGCLEEIFFLLV